MCVVKLTKFTLTQRGNLLLYIHRMRHAKQHTITKQCLLDKISDAMSVQHRIVFMNEQPEKSAL